MQQNIRLKPAVSLESILFTVAVGGFFAGLCGIMGAANAVNTLMRTAHQLLLNTVFFIMAVTVLTGALGAVLSEFGVMALFNRLLSPLMKPLYDLPGAAAMGMVTTYFSDNPAIITLTNNRSYRRYFRKYQIPALTNLGTAFGMGLIVTAFMIGQRSPAGEDLIKAALIGDLGAILGSIVSVRLMLLHTRRIFGRETPAVQEETGGIDLLKMREIREGNAGKRMLEAILEGGKSGVDMGLSIIPGVIVICTLVMMLTNGPGAGGFYTGAPFEGIRVLPWLGEKLSFLLKPLFGFRSAEAIAFPITSVGAVGAAISMVPRFLSQGLIGGNEIAVFTAMGMCWSGYLSTHVAMMDALQCRELTGKAILSHTVGGLVAGIAAHLVYMLLA